MEHELRVSDEDRERTAQSLRDHFAAGRLSQDEFDERVQAAYQASTGADLHRLLADLPALPASPAQQRAELVARRSKLQRRVLQESGGAVAAFLVCTVIWLASGASGSFWPIWVALFAVIPLVRGGWALYGPDADLDRFERELNARGKRGGPRHIERHHRRRP